MKIQKAIDPVINQLESDDEDVAIASAYALNKLNGLKGKEKLIKRLKRQDLTRDSNLTGTLIETLGAFKAKELLKMAIESINNPKTTKLVRESFVLFLGKIESPKSKEILEKLYKDPEEDLIIRSYAVNSLSRLGATGSADVIKAVLKEIDSYPFKKKRDTTISESIQLPLLLNLATKVLMKDFLKL